MSARDRHRPWFRRTAAAYNAWKEACDRWCDVCREPHREREEHGNAIVFRCPRGRQTETIFNDGTVRMHRLLVTDWPWDIGDVPDDVEVR